MRDPFLYSYSENNVLDMYFNNIIIMKSNTPVRKIQKIK